MVHEGLSLSCRLPGQWQYSVICLRSFPQHQDQSFMWVAADPANPQAVGVTNSALFSLYLTCGTFKSPVARFSGTALSALSKSEVQIPYKGGASRTSRKRELPHLTSDSESICMPRLAKTRKNGNCRRLDPIAY